MARKRINKFESTRMLSAKDDAMLTQLVELEKHIATLRVDLAYGLWATAAVEASQAYTVLEVIRLRLSGKPHQHTFPADR